MGSLNASAGTQCTAEAERLARFAELETELRRLTGVLAALDLLPIGVIVLDGEGRVLKSNALASQLLSRADGLLERDERLGATDAKAAAELRQAIKEIGGGGEIRPQGLWLPRPGGKPLSVVVTAAPTRGFIGADTVGLINVAVFVTDPESPLHPVPGIIQKMFCLTPAEARVAEHFVGGKTVDETAACCKITRGTVRTHLKRVFEKTEVSSQSALVRLILNTPAWIGNRIASIV